MENEKIKVWNWQRVHNENASSEGWVYKMLMDKRITVLEGGAVKALSTGDIANVGDYIVLFDDTDELRVVGKADFEANYERMT